MLRGKVSSAIKPNPPRPNCSTRPSLPHESNNSGANRNKVNRTQSEKSGDKDAEKRERIERLRSQGWQVTKEKHGYKGGEYYERLRREAGEEVLARVGVGGQGKQLHRICLGG